ETLREVQESRGTRGNHAFYLSIPPNSFDVVCEKLSAHGLASRQEETAARNGRSTPWSRVVIEKPFGHDLA
ncbi:hypothetical protein ACPXAU_24805, partial [Salmonella enterica]